MKQNYFELFKLPSDFNIDLNLLEQSYQQVMRQVHPDRQQKQELQQRLAAQYAALANDAYHCLKDPVFRAAYLAKQQGVDTELEQVSIHDAAFLEQLIMWEECLEEVRSVPDSSRINSLQQEIHQAIVEQESAFAGLYTELRKAENTSINAFASTAVNHSIDQNTKSCITDIISKMRFLYKLKKQLMMIPLKD